VHPRIAEQVLWPSSLWSYFMFFYYGICKYL